MSFFGLFGDDKKKKVEAEQPKKRKLSALERLEEQRRLMGQSWTNPFDKDRAIRRIFPRQGVGGIGVRVKRPKVSRVSAAIQDGESWSPDPYSVSAMDADENGGGSRADSLRAQDRVERDAFYNPLAMYGMDEKVLQYYESRVWIGYPAMAHLGTHELMSGICDIPAREAIARGFKIDIVDEDSEDGDNNKSDDDEVVRENSKKCRKLLRDANRKYKISDVLRQFGCNKRMYGVAYVIPVFKEGDEFDYSKPFNIDGIRKNSFVGMKVVEPIWMSYEFKDSGANSPISVNFYDPEWYRIANGTRIHKSWIIKKVYVPVSDLLKPTYYFGGLSLTQMCYERIYCADKVANECPMLVMTKRLLIADANVQAMTNDKSVAELTMQALNYFRDNFSVFFKNPGTQVSQIDTSLEGLPQVSMMEYQLAAAIAGMPVTKLLKNVPTGLQSTGDYEMDDYHELLLDIQRDYGEILDFFFKIWTKSEYGKSLDISVTFNELDVPKRDEVIQAESQISSIMSTYLSSKVVTVAEVRQIIRNQTNGLFAGISAKVPDELQKAIDAEQKQLEQQMNPPANPMGGGLGGGEGGGLGGDTGLPKEEGDEPIDESGEGGGTMTPEEEEQMTDSALAQLQNLAKQDEGAQVVQ